VVPFARAAKVEYCVVTWLSPQDGHRVESSARRTSFSNLVPHPSHTYSNIGMIFYSVNSNAILSIHLRTSLDGAEKLFTMIENASHPRVLLWAYPDSAMARLKVPVLA
jgi:hypothetical protein